MDRIKALEEGFQKRYNRNAEVYRDVFTADQKFTKVVVSIIHADTTYVLTEYFTPEQLTDYVTLEFNDKSHKYSRYIDAEIHVADLIGEQDGNTK